MNAEMTKKKPISFSDSRLALSISKDMVEHNKRVTALKLQSVAETAAMALRRSTVNRKEINGGSKTAETKRSLVPLRASMSSKRLKTKKESNSLSVPLTKIWKLVDEKHKDLVEEKTLYVIKMKTGNEIVESDKNQSCVMDSPRFFC